MDKKVVVFSQLDREILTQLEQKYEVAVVDPRQGDVNQQILKLVENADGM
ncbi:hypothetical protein [Acinetobacter chinensis]